MVFKRQFRRFKATFHLRYDSLITVTYDPHSFWVGVIIIIYKQISPIMSTLHHEAILENLYDEAYVECAETGFFMTEDLESAAQFLAQIRFEELAQ